MYMNVWWENTILVEQCTGFSRGSSGIRIKPGLGQWLNTRGDAKIFVNVKQICSCKLLSMMCFTLKQLHLHIENLWVVIKLEMISTIISRGYVCGNRTVSYDDSPLSCLILFIVHFWIYLLTWNMLGFSRVAPIYPDAFFCDKSSIHERLPLKSHSV